jgi:hypothetical protein
MLALALALAAQDAPGVRFQCTPRGLEGVSTGFGVFAPASKARDRYTTDHGLFTQAVERRGAPPFREGLEITDELPARLVLLWRREHNSPVTLTITDYNAAAGAARYVLSAERNPASRVSTMQTVTGSCAARAVQGNSQ